VHSTSVRRRRLLNIVCGSRDTYIHTYHLYHLYMPLYGSAPQRAIWSLEKNLEIGKSSKTIGCPHTLPNSELSVGVAGVPWVQFRLWACMLDRVDREPPVANAAVRVLDGVISLLQPGSLRCDCNQQHMRHRDANRQVQADPALFSPLDAAPDTFTHSPIISAIAIATENERKQHSLRSNDRSTSMGTTADDRAARER
jgi:hypothetical protein